MSLQPGTLLGPYEILTPLGAGGMGEVYKARDGRLNRFVAVKVLPEHLAQSPDALARFEREAKAVAALNHPNLLGIFDFATQGPIAYVVMELLEGESLRARLEQGPFSPRRATELAIQMAHGLAAAHAKGIIHRDLKPDNLWLTLDGRLKILDFGLAKQLPTLEGGSGSIVPTQGIGPGPLTERGMILGTLGYMSPEQVRGEAVDARADLFSLGAVLYELLTGRKAFSRSTSADTMAAILKEDPPDLPDSSRPMPPGLRRIIDRCLEKLPARRFQNADDLAFALDNLGNASEGSPALTVPFAARNRRVTWLWGSLAAAVAAGALLGGWALRGGPRPPPTFRRLTSVPGTIETARFGPDGRTVYFSERLNGGKPELFVLDPRSQEAKALGIHDAFLLDVSASNELAFIHTPRLKSGESYRGVLTQAPGGGGAQRELREGVAEAAWDGAGLAILEYDARAYYQLEFPAGQRILEVNGSSRTLGHLALSADGRTLALADGDTVKATTSIVTYDRQGHRRVLYTKEGDGSEATLTGMAWGPGGELWLSELQGDQTALWALGKGGAQRQLWRSQGSLQLLDVARDGSVLLAQHQVRRSVLVQKAGDPKPQDLSIQSSTQAGGFTPDGRNVLLMESPVMDGGTAQDRAYLRPADGGLPLAMGHGAPGRISLDGRWVFMDTTAVRSQDLDPAWAQAYQDAGLPAADLGNHKAMERYFLFVPTGMGKPFALAIPAGFEANGGAAEPLPGDRQVVANLARDGKDHWVALDRSGAPPRVITREGLGLSFASLEPLSRDGTRLIVSGNRIDWFIQPVAGGEPTPIKGLLPDERVMAWAPAGDAVYVRTELSVLPVVITRLDLRTGARARLSSFSPPEAAGHIQTRGVYLTRDARASAYTCEKKLSELYLVEGLR